MVTKLNILNLALIALLVAMLAVQMAGADTSENPAPVVLPFISS